jgi:threonine dehydrogenase-like Zn-dependent dehydrogenase
MRVAGPASLLARECLSPWLFANSLRSFANNFRNDSFYTGQTPVLKYNRQLMQAILYGRLPIAKIVNATVISLDEAPTGYKDLDKGAAKKFVLDPHGVLAKAA